MLTRLLTPPFDAMLPSNSSPPALHPSDAEALPHLAQVLAHRLRGLVTSIEGFTDLLLATLDTQEQRDLALRIFESAASIEHVLTDLHRYGRVQALCHEAVAMRALLDAVMKALPDEALERLTLDVQVPKPCALDADPLQLRQALLNIVGNALEATRPNGAVHLRIAPDVDPRFVCIDVRNDGWIDEPEAATLVFTPFYTTKAHNLGVGLPMARRLVEAMGGTLVLTDNSAERGTCFTLRLPLQGG